LRSLIDGAIWNEDIASQPRWRARLIKLVRIVYVVGRDLTEGQLTLRAMSLVYTTLLSMVPLLAVSFSVLKGFGVHNQIEPLLLRLMAPLGEQGVEVAGRIIGFVENIKVGLLGSVGLALLFYTVVSLIQKIERTFNYIWHTSQSRSLARRFSDYLSVILIGPVLMFAAMGLTASVSSATVVQKLVSLEPLGTLIKTVTQLVPYFLVVGAFTFVYSFIPNTRVRLSSALTGAVVAGVLWEVIGWLFASFVVSSTKYAAIYSGFAILIVFMIWLYLSWLVLLIGASIAFYHQHPEYLKAEPGEVQLSGRLREKLALLVMFLIGQSHYGQRPAWTMDGLAQTVAVPKDAVADVLGALENRGLLIQSCEEPPGYLPTAALETVSVTDVLDAVRAAGESPYLNAERLRAEPPVEKLVRRFEAAAHEALGRHTLKDLVLSQPLGTAASEQTLE
jgi:membrane protein